MSRERHGKHGVQSFEIGMRILQVLLAGGRAMMLKDIAATAAMPAPKVHRYMVSMVRTGLVEQDPATSLYSLGPFALEIGLVAADRLDGIELGLGAIAHLRTTIDEATALATWTSNGPVVVRWERSRRPVAISVATGTALEMLTTASGRVFGAWLAPELSRPLIDAQRARASHPRALRTRSSIERLFAQARRDGVAVIAEGHASAGIASIGAPVFDHRGEVVFAMSVVGIQGMLDTSVTGAPARALRAAAQALSERLGHRPAARG
ncbi:MAG TPA: IclR family transcriptional regulator [Zeimonas sp.]